MPPVKPVRMTQTTAPKSRMQRTRSREPQNGDGFIFLLGHRLLILMPKANLSRTGSVCMELHFALRG
jgi:hypothetical protein